MVKALHPGSAGAFNGEHGEEHWGQGGREGQGWRRHEKKCNAALRPCHHGRGVTAEVLGFLLRPGFWPPGAPDFPKQMSHIRARCQAVIETKGPHLGNKGHQCVKQPR